PAKLLGSEAGGCTVTVRWRAPSWVGACSAGALLAALCTPTWGERSHRAAGPGRAAEVVFRPGSQVGVIGWVHAQSVGGCRDRGAALCRVPGRRDRARAGGDHHHG